MNKKALDLAGVTEMEYYKWCRENHKTPYKTETKREFFSKIQQGKLVRNENGNIVKKYLSEV